VIRSHQKWTIFYYINVLVHFPASRNLCVINRQHWLCSLIQWAMFTRDAWRHDYYLRYLLKCRTWSFSTYHSLYSIGGWHDTGKETPSTQREPCLSQTSLVLTWYHTQVSPSQQTTLVMGHIHACKSCHGVQFHHSLYIQHHNKNYKIISSLHTLKWSFFVPMSIHVWTLTCSAMVNSPP
jgi:hypothetical protein